jgi:YihY family inner membrane protein
VASLRAALPGVRGAYRLGRSAIDRYFRYGCSQYAAAISYRALFSLVPLATFAATVLATVLQGHDEARADVVAAVSDRFRLTQDGAADLDELVASVPSPWSFAGLLSLGIALWGATGVMTSVQKTLAVVFDEGATRSFVRGRLVSALLVLGVLGLMLVAVGLSVLEGVAKKVSEDLQGAMEWEPYGVGFLFGVVIPLVVTFTVFLGLLRGLPRRRPSLGAAAVGAAVGAIAFQVVQAGLAWYLSGPVDFTEIYGSASAIFAFLLSIYLGAGAFVAGVVLASVLDEAMAPDAGGATS